MTDTKSHWNTINFTMKLIFLLTGSQFYLLEYWQHCLCVLCYRVRRADSTCQLRLNYHIVFPSFTVRFFLLSKYVLKLCDFKKWLQGTLKSNLWWLGSSFSRISLKMGVFALESLVEKRCPDAIYPVDIRKLAAKALKSRKGISPLIMFWLIVFLRLTFI